VSIAIVGGLDHRAACGESVDRVAESLRALVTKMVTLIDVVSSFVAQRFASVLVGKVALAGG